MDNKIIPLSWDTNFFGFNIAKIDATNLSENEVDLLLKDAKKNNVELIYIFSGSELNVKPSASADYEINLVDSKVIFQKKMLGNIEDERDIERMQQYNEKDIEELYFLALESGYVSRFKHDTKLNSQFEKLYQTWVDNSINKKYADEIFVYRIDNSIAGFVSLKYDLEKSTVGLIAVHPRYRGYKVGEKLMNKCFSESFINGIKYLNVATQMENEGAVRFYQKLNMEIVETTKIYHAWIKK